MSSFFTNMATFKEHISKFKRSVKEFHTKKPQLEFFTALLTIPVLLTVIILNLNNLNSNKKDESSKNSTIVITQPSSKEVIVTKEACKEGIGSISIDNPDEGDDVSDNPVSVDISYRANGYCAVVWSYRINGGKWSSYDDRSIALYNLPQGDIKFDLRVKSVVNDDSKNLTRNFTYSGEANTSPTPTVAPSAIPTNQ